MAELVDALGSGPSGGNTVEVRVLFWAPLLATGSHGMSEITHHTDYRQALAAIKQRIQSSQTRAVLAVNAELLRDDRAEDDEVGRVDGEDLYTICS